jgi:hypothetical protein
MPVHWSYAILEQLGDTTPAWGTVILSLLVLSPTIVLAYLVTVLLLRRAEW